MTPDDWLTIRECAERLGKPQRTVRDYAGRLPAEARRKNDPLPLMIHYPTLAAYLRGEVRSPSPPQSDQDARTDAPSIAADNSPLLEQLRAENAFLREHIAAMTRVVESAARQSEEREGELRALHGELREAKVQAITAGEGSEQRQEAARPWWKWWGR